MRAEVRQTVLDQLSRRDMADVLSYGAIHQGKGCCSMAEVRIQEGESIESALRRFKRRCQQEDIIKDIKKPPSI